MADIPVTLPIGASDETAAAFSSVKRRLNLLGQQFDSFNDQLKIGKSPFASFGDMSKKIGGGFTKVGQALTLGVTVPTIAAGAAAIKTSGDFEAALNDLQVRTGANAADMGRLTDEARNLGRTTRFSATQAAEGMIVLGKAGQSTEQILVSTGAALNLAASEGIEMGQSAEFISDTLNQFRLNASEAVRVSDQLAKASGISSISISDLQNSMKYAAPAAATFGLKLNDVGGAIAALGQVGIKGEMAGTSLRSLFNKITGDKNAQQLLIKKGLKSDGSDLFTDSKLTQLKTIPEILEALSKANLTAVDVHDIFGKEFGSTIRNMIENRKLVSDFAKQVDDSAGFAAATGQARMKGFNGQVTLLKNAFQDLFIEITTGSGGPLEILTGFVTTVKDIVAGYRDLSPAARTAIGLTVAIAAAAGPAALALGAIATSIGSIGTAIALSEITGIALGGTLVAIGATAAIVLGSVVAIGSAFLIIRNHIDSIGRAWGRFQNVFIDFANKYLNGKDNQTKRVMVSDDINLADLARDTALPENRDNMSRAINPFDSSPQGRSILDMESINRSENLKARDRKDQLFITLGGFPAQTTVKADPQNQSGLNVDMGQMMGAF